MEYDNPQFIAAAKKVLVSENQPTQSAPEGGDDTNNDAKYPRGNRDSEMQVPPSDPSYKITSEKKRDKWDIAKFVAEFVGLGFLILYTLYTAGIYRANSKAASAARDTLGEVQKQTVLMRQQLVGSQSAVVEFSDRPELSVNDLGEAKSLTLNFVNNGQIITRNVPIHTEIARLTWPGKKQIGNNLSLGWTILALPPMKPSNGSTAKIIPYALSRKELEPIVLLQETVKITGGVVYDDGFGDKTAWDFCFYFLGRGNLQPGRIGSFQDCDVFPIARQGVLRDNARQNAQ
jgi:hypothetical protein